MNRLIKLLRKYYHKSIHSVGFYPAIIALGFLVAFIVLYGFEESGIAVRLKREFVWMNIRATETARAILTTIAAGIIGLTVFSFSMVMVVISQAASQISNRLLDNLIGNRYQQLILGFYLGTVLGSFFLLMVIDDQATEQIPSLTVFTLVALTIVDLFLFVSFLNYITQSTRYEKLIEGIHQRTIRSMEERAGKGKTGTWKVWNSESRIVFSPRSDYFQGVNGKQLLRYAAQQDVQVEFIPLRCTYVVKGEPLLKIHSAGKLDDKTVEEILNNVDFYTGQEIDKNPFYGFLHLSEVAIKALSPGINDPNTAVLSIHALTDLFVSKLRSTLLPVLCDEDGRCRIFIPERSFDDLFSYCIYPIWDYGKNDRFVQQAMRQMLQQLVYADKDSAQAPTLQDFKLMIQA